MPIVPVAFVGFLVVAAAAVLVPSYWSGRRASRTHQAALSRLSAEEIRERALGWLTTYRETRSPSVEALARLVETGRYGQVLDQWRHFRTALCEAVDWDVRKEGPPPTWILRDYLWTLERRESQAAA